MWFLPMRRRILKAEGASTFLRPLIRRAGLGIAALTALKDPAGNYRAKIARRSRAVSTYMDALHVAPAGMCNTRGTTLDDDFLTISITCEFLEELFSLKEFEESKGYDWKNKVRQKVTDIAREANLQPQDWSLLAVALCIDLLNLRPELCVVIAVHKASFLQKYGSKQLNRLGLELNINEEYVGPLFAAEGKSAMPVTDSVQSGACAYHVGREVLTRLAFSAKVSAE
jgi:hypothetical protein